MYSEITQKNKLEILGKLTASLSHELRNPLSAIKLNLDYMKLSSDNLDSELKDSLANCIDGVQRIELLIENILSFSRKTRNNNSWVSINEVSDTAINLSLAKARHANINIFTDYSDSLPKVNFNKSNLLQVFLNLITNAIEACEGKRGEIKIKSYLEQQAHDKNIVWEISDNGIGIKEEDKEKIFSEFFTNKNNGTGIGLNVCRTLLREKEADLKFNSVYGQGTTFKVIFKNGSKSNDE